VAGGHQGINGSKLGSVTEPDLSPSNGSDQKTETAGELVYSTILIPIDVGQPDMAVQLARAAKTLAGTDTKFICINVVEKLPAFALSALPPDLTEKTEAEARSRLEEAVKSADLKASIEVRSGQAAQMVLGAAKEFGADLIVVGSHQPELQDFLLGSTAARIVRHAECDVLVKRVKN